jgi:hypothetical protein
VKRLLLIAVVIAVGWYGNYHFGNHDRQPLFDIAWSRLADTDSASFRCDGRTRCSQMTSCEEAIYFVRHCPNTEMDGDADGIPCERQWCN